MVKSAYTQNEHTNLRNGFFTLLKLSSKYSINLPYFNTKNNNGFIKKEYADTNHNMLEFDQIDYTYL